MIVQELSGWKDKQFSDTGAGRVGVYKSRGHAQTQAWKEGRQAFIYPHRAFRSSKYFQEKSKSSQKVIHVQDLRFFHQVWF